MPRRRGQEALGVEGLMTEAEGRRLCGSCRHIEDPNDASSCGVLKTGSDILADPPVFVLSGVADFQTDPRRDATRCEYYEARSGLGMSC